MKKRKTISKKKTIGEKPTLHKKTSSELAVERVLIDNFISLQKVLTNLSVKFDNLSDKITELLNLFEISAKALTKQDFEIGKHDKEILGKLDKLADQNKIIARGLTLIHEKEKPEYYEPETVRLEPKIPKPLTSKKEGVDGYQKSIASSTEESG